MEKIDCHFMVTGSDDESPLGMVQMPVIPPVGSIIRIAGKRDEHRVDRVEFEFDFMRGTKAMHELRQCCVFIEPVKQRK